MNDEPNMESGGDGAFSDSVRTMLRTAVADAPPAPPVEAISDLSWHAVSHGARKPRPVVRIGLGVATAVALVAGLVVSAQHASDRGRAPLTNTSTTDVRLPSHVLPATVPDGWELADVVEGTSVGVVTRPAMQLFRAGDASIRIFIEPMADPNAEQPVTATTAVFGAVGRNGNADRASASFQNSLATFNEDGANVHVETHGASDADAVAFLRQLAPSGSGSDLRYASPDVSWQLEATSAYEGPTPTNDVFGLLAYRTAPELSSIQSTFTISLSLAPADGTWRIGAPMNRNGVTLYAADQYAVRQIGDLLAGVSYDPASPLAARQKDAALATLAALAPVDASAFDQAADRVAAHYAAQPATTTLRVGDATVTRHAMADDDAICVTGGRGGLRCHRPPALNNGEVRPYPFDVDFLVDGLWLHVGAVDFKATDITATDGTRKGVTALTDTTEGVMYAAVAPHESRSMVVAAIVPEGGSVEFDGSRPHI